MSKQIRKEKLAQSDIYRWMQNTTRYLDKYYLDGIIGFIPGGIGDIFSSLFSLVHLYFSIFCLRSIPLTLAILYNTLRDILLGLIPFYVGNVIDFFHKAHIRNMELIEGFINDDKEIIRSVNKKAVFSVIMIVVFCIVIYLLILLITYIAKSLGSILFA